MTLNPEGRNREEKGGPSARPSISMPLFTSSASARLRTRVWGSVNAALFLCKAAHEGSGFSRQAAHEPRLNQLGLVNLASVKLTSVNMGMPLLTCSSSARLRKRL